MTLTHPAMLWEPADNDTVRCKLCAHRCRIAPGDFGYCNVRQNENGQLVTYTYDQLIAIHADPIEKKPLFHFLPGTETFSIATPGCNFRCAFCQNWQISQLPRNEGTFRPSNESYSPEKIVSLATQHHCASISYTYTEPTIFFELAHDTAVKAYANGLRNCFVSNGYMTLQAVETIAPYLDAINVDLKAFRDDTYKREMGARLQPVLDALEALVQAGVWVEVTTLIVPEMNDSAEELQQMAEFIANTLGANVPWHVSRFHGDYQKLDTPSTPIETLTLACRLGREAGLKHIYCGNVPGQTDERTYCPGCGEVLIDRQGFSVGAIRLKDGACPACGQAIAGVWD